MGLAALALPYMKPEIQWPIVAVRALSDLQLTGEVPAGWSDELRATARGYVQVSNAMLELRRLSRSSNPVVAGHAGQILLALIELRERWPITLV